MSVKRGVRKVSESGEDLCPVCSEVITIFAIGHCDHVICYRCSTRMRSLCNQMYCSICRTDLDTVYFSPVLRQYAKCDLKKALDLSSDGIVCEDEKCEASYRKLMEQQCPRCDRNHFRDFRQLRAHVRKEHTMFYCDICVDNLKIFTFERKVYSRSDLARHRRVGDADDTSHKGHPICEFCDERYLDNDELLRHLRKEHYYCHICDTGGAHQYYSDYDLLLVHFKDYHFVCEEDECAGTQFTNVFKSVIDLKAHRSQAHSAGKKRSAAKQDRVLDVPIGLPTRRPTRDNDRESGRGRRDHHRDRREEERTSTPPTEVQKQPDLEDEEDFPSISAQSNMGEFKSGVNDTMAKRVASTAGHNVGWVDEDVEDYPPLGDPTRPPPEPIPVRAKPKPPPKTKAKVRNFESIDEEFPALSGSGPPNVMRVERGSAPSFSSISGMIAPAPTPNVTTYRPVEVQEKRVQKPASFDVDDFPSLGGGAMDSNPPTWVTAKSGNKSAKSAKKGKKVAPMPDLSSIADAINDSASVPSKPDLDKPDNSVKTESTNKSTNSETTVKSRTKTSGKTGEKKGSLVTDYLADIAQDFGSSTVDQGDSDAAKYKSKNKNAKKKKKKKGKGNNEDEENENDNDQVMNTKTFESPADDPATPEEEPSPPVQPTEKPKSLGRDSPKLKMIDTNSDHRNGWTLVSGSHNNNNNSVKPAFGNDDFPSLSSIAKSMPLPTREIPKNTKVITTSKHTRNEEDFPSLSSIARSTSTPASTISYGPKPSSKQREPSSRPQKTPAFGADEFPPLENEVVMKAPPPSKAPPGFRAMVPDTPPTDLYEPEYILPRNYKERNGKLMHKIRQLLGHSESRFESFKIISGTYRLNDISAEEYYHQCKNLVGEKFRDVFPELLVLLPDIAKQNELYGAHLIEISKNLKNDLGASELLGCSTCRQIVRANELKEHNSSHGLAAMGGRKA